MTDAVEKTMTDAVEKTMTDAEEKYYKNLKNMNLDTLKIECEKLLAEFDIMCGGYDEDLK